MSVSRFVWLTDAKPSRQDLFRLMYYFPVGFIWYQVIYCCIRQEEQVSRACAFVTCLHITGLNGILDTVHIRIYIPSNKSEFCQYEHKRQLGVVMNVINDCKLIIPVSPYLTWMIGNFQYLLHVTSKFRTSLGFKTTTSVFHQYCKNQGCRETPNVYVKYFVTRGRSGDAMKVPQTGTLPPYPLSPRHGGC